VQKRAFYMERADNDTKGTGFLHKF